MKSKDDVLEELYVAQDTLAMSNQPMSSNEYVSHYC